ncbi:MAG: hypothetical protein GFH27_549287n357 [Chloroflexi bacterium AL-W]|nr:hypothetical protein [Chloroflexi bacterium AL-W]
MLTYNLHELPFSRAGSFLTISAQNGTGSLRLAYKTCSARSVSVKDSPFWAHDFFELALLKDQHEVPYTWTAQPHRLDLHTENSGSVTLVFLDSESILFATRGVSLRLLPYKPFATLHHPHPDQLILYDRAAHGMHYFHAGANTELRYTPTATLHGVNEYIHQTPYTIEFIGKPNAHGAFRFTQYETPWEAPLPPIDTTIQQRDAELTAWLQQMPIVSEHYHHAAKQAWLVLWSNQVPAYGYLTRPTIYCSQFSMAATWAWDNCFHALAVTRANPELAWDQLRLFFDHQTEQGQIPDPINDLNAIYGHTKPPIFGWTIRKMVNWLGVEASRPYIEQLYEPVARFTNWWYHARDVDHDGMCLYLHGNDSGWDNATIFDEGFPVKGPDLAAYLSQQMESLAFMADILEKKDAAAEWKHRAKQQRTFLFEHSVSNQRFMPIRNGTHTTATGQSLINTMPIILGRHLPDTIRTTLLGDLAPEGPFLTPYGYASESPQSPKYETDGYWRGPIWASANYLIIEGLIDAGASDLARLVAQRFCDMCASNSGFWENYNALTGEGLRCPGYTWSAAVFILLAEWLGI